MLTMILCNISLHVMSLYADCLLRDEEYLYWSGQKETIMKSFFKTYSNGYNAATVYAADFGHTRSQGFLANLKRNWRARTAVANLELQDDHLLRDIGVTRAEVRQAASVSLRCNAALVLLATARKRRQKYGQLE